MGAEHGESHETGVLAPPGCEHDFGGTPHRETGLVCLRGVVPAAGDLLFAEPECVERLERGQALGEPGTIDQQHVLFDLRRIHVAVVGDAGAEEQVFLPGLRDHEQERWWRRVEQPGPPADAGRTIVQPGREHVAIAAPGHRVAGLEPLLGVRGGERLPGLFRAEEHAWLANRVHVRTRRPVVVGERLGERGPWPASTIGRTAAEPARIRGRERGWRVRRRAEHAPGESGRGIHHVPTRDPSNQTSSPSAPVGQRRRHVAQ